jgi:hypothetical protein
MHPPKNRKVMGSIFARVQRSVSNKATTLYPGGIRSHGPWLQSPPRQAERMPLDYTGHTKQCCYALAPLCKIPVNLFKMSSELIFISFDYRHCACGQCDEWKPSGIFHFFLVTTCMYVQQGLQGISVSTSRVARW